MKYKERNLSDKIKRIAEQFPVIVISGARQVGKSTLIKHLFKEHDFILLDPLVDIGNARQDPDLFLDNHPTPLILDEIQYAPELVPAIKRRVDNNKQPGMYILTGSQQWSVLKSISESLAGRAILIRLDSFSISEIYEYTEKTHWLEKYIDNPEEFLKTPHKQINTSRTLYEQLWRGTLPEVDSLDIDFVSEYHQSYIQTYIERDIRQLAEVNNPQQFSRFCQLASALTAQEINKSQIGREIGIIPQTAMRWLEMLKGTFQWCDVPAFHSNTIKRISSKPKGYFTDTGLICHLQLISSPKALSGHPLLGHIFETFVMSEIYKLSQTMSTPPRFYHWRSHSGAEVDIILERDGRFFPIEIKLSTMPAKRDTTGISKFKATYPDLQIETGLVIAPIEKISKLSDTAYACPLFMV
jgi:predicted AAA+ superfamily ATPase